MALKRSMKFQPTYVGGKLYITLHAYVNPELSVEEAHKIAETIEQKIQARD